jgi:hypothetical protein
MKTHKYHVPPVDSDAFYFSITPSIASPIIYTSVYFLNPRSCIIVPHRRHLVVQNRTGRRRRRRRRDVVLGARRSCYTIVITLLIYLGIVAFHAARSSRTDPDDDVVDVTSFSSLDVAEINKRVCVCVRRVRHETATKQCCPCRRPLSYEHGSCHQRAKSHTGFHSCHDENYTNCACADCAKEHKFLS